MILLNRSNTSSESFLHGDWAFLNSSCINTTCVHRRSSFTNCILFRIALILRAHSLMLIWGISWGSLKSECSYLLQESSGTTHLSFVGFNVTFIHFTREIFSPLTALWKFKTVHIQSLFFFLISNVALPFLFLIVVWFLSYLLNIAKQNNISQTQHS